MLDNAEIHVYDPKVTKEQIIKDLNYLAEQNLEFSAIKDQMLANLIVHNDPFTTMDKALAVAVLTEWDAFKTYNWQKVYDKMLKPAFVFDGRNILSAKELRNIGFKVYQIGKS